MSEALTIHGPSRMAEAPGSRTQPSRGQREATDFEDREGHRAPFASIVRAGQRAHHERFIITYGRQTTARLIRRRVKRLNDV
jgi:hypothetical protein